MQKSRKPLVTRLPTPHGEREHERGINGARVVGVFQPLMGNGNGLDAVALAILNILPTPHGEREPDASGTVVSNANTFQPLMGNGNRC